MLRVDIGCGDSKPVGFIGVDICSGSAVDIVADLSKTFPFEDSSVDELRAYDAIEHFPDRIHTMNEIWRVCKSGAKVDIFVPSTDGRGAFQDPTHVSFWNINSFNYYCIDFPGYFHLCQKYGFKGAFKVLTLEHHLSPEHVVHVKAVLEVVKPVSEIIRSQPTLTSHQISSAVPHLNFPSISSLVENKSRPFWSVMLPVYNPNPDYLRQALKSILEQDPGVDSMQIEIVDDCSTEVDVEAIVQEVGQGRIQFYRQLHNLGLISNWNACLEQSRGKWIHLFHQDDLILPNFYNHFKPALEKNPAIGAAFCRHYHIDTQGNQQYLTPLENETPGILENWLAHIGVMQRIQFASIVVKRRVYEQVGGFCLEASSGADWEMWKRIAVQFPIWYEPEPLACFRIHSASESSRLLKTGKNVADTRRSIQISESYLPKSMVRQLTEQALERYAISAFRTAQYFLKIEDNQSAIAQIREGLKCSQSAQIKEELINIFLNNQIFEISDKSSDNFSRKIEHYQDKQINQLTVADLTRLRQKLTEQILNTSEEQLRVDYQRHINQMYRAVLQRGFK